MCVTLSHLGAMYVCLYVSVWTGHTQSVMSLPAPPRQSWALGVCGSAVQLKKRFPGQSLYENDLPLHWGGPVN